MVSTNEIARRAGLSIGTLYAYYDDKKAILLALLQRYNDSFEIIFQKLNTPASLDLFQTAPREWLSGLLDLLLKQENPQFHRQIESLGSMIPEVQLTLKVQKEKMQELTYNCLTNYYGDSLSDRVQIRAGVILLFDFITALVDELLYGPKDPKIKATIAQQGLDFLTAIIQNWQTPFQPNKKSS
ncbi:TetR/AcrR family transcriptional regulator [Lactobacillus sp. DCY120]|uniref:TetR/AcrR family transcriptional regulator n=1 Tax=Bombilactobacillus apium TaxID=2675299 RepID=A0A850R432_9LACO|nr:TetR/AcrR family transcriptional regulator [Bombilactobacillus apium]NVY96731.1 TetR/AcrR family transcriptional regulator [Bombilactobacillus apium]